jgi:hypothetical protein
MDAKQYYVRTGKRGGFIMGADDDFVGPPAPTTSNTNNFEAIFGGITSVAKSIADSVIQGQLSINKNGVVYNGGIPSTVPQMQYTTTVPPKPDYAKYALIAAVPILGLLLLTGRKR